MFEGRRYHANPALGLEAKGMLHSLPNIVRKVTVETASRFDLCASFINQSQVKNFAEIGVWRGHFAEHILRCCPSIEQYYMVDPWQHLDDWNKPANVSDQEFEQIFSEALERTAFASDKRVIVRATTKQALAQLEGAELDAVYIDSNHTLRGITIDLISLYDRIKPHGFILGDDFVPSIWQHPERFEPTLVFPFAVYFAEAKGDQIFGLPFNQFLISKTLEPDAFQFHDMTGLYQETNLRKQFLNVPSKRNKAMLRR
jgi:hypothetical protein